MSTITNQEEVNMKRTYEKLSRKSRLYNRYANPASNAFILGVILMVTWALLLSWFFPKGSLSEPFETLKVFSMLIPLVLTIPIMRILYNKAEPFRLRHEEWLFLDVYEALTNLDSFLEMGMESDRHKAAKKVKRIIEKVDKSWKPGALKLIQDLYGEHLATFRRNLKERVHPNIEEGDEQDLKKSYTFLMNFARYLLKPNHSINDIEQLNTEMSAIKVLTVEKQKLIDQLITHPLMKHFIALIGCGVGGIFAFLVGVYYLNVAKEYAYTAAFAFTGTLIIAYVSYLKRK